MTEADYRLMPDDLFEEVFRAEHPEYYTSAAPVEKREDPNKERVKGIWAAAMAKGRTPAPRPIRPIRPIR